MVAKKELTREEVSLRIGCSIGTVQKFEREKKLNPRREKVAGSTRVWFDPEEVEKVARDYKPTRMQRVKVDERLVESNIRGKLAGKILPMFDQGATLAQICAATEADPLIVAQLYETWQLGPAGIIKKKELERQLEKREAVQREERRRDYDKQRRREWMEMRVEIARLEGRKSLALPRLDPRPQDDKEKKTG